MATGLRHSCDVGSQAPPLSLVYVEKIGEPGDEASHRVHYFTLYQPGNNLVAVITWL